MKLGEDISVARRKRRISTVSMAERAFISRGTLYKWNEAIRRSRWASTRRCWRFWDLPTASRERPTGAMIPSD